MKKAHRHQVSKKAAAVVFSCSMILSNMQFMPILAQDGIKEVKGAGEEFNDFTNISADSTLYTKNSAGNYTMNRNGGNNRLIADITAKAFTYEAKVKIEEGDRGSLVFGATNHSYDNPGSFFGLEFSATNGNIFVKMFQDNGPGGELLHSTEVLHNVDTSKEIDVALSIDNDKNITLYINNEISNITVDEKFKDVYLGGYLGLLTWQSKVTFSDIKITRFSDSTSDFKTNLKNLKGLRGEWKESDEGLYSNGGGDNFAMSETVGSDFIYSATVKVAKDGAAALVFRSNDDGSNSYVANISRNEKRARIFKFPGGIDIGSAPLKDATKDTYDLRVEAMGSSFRYYVDDELVTAGNDTSYTSGKFGLLTFNGAMTYQNLQQKSLDTTTYPQLSNLEIIGNGAILSPSFKTDAASYDLYVPRSALKLRLKAASNADSMSMRITDRKGNEILSETAFENNVESDVLALPSGASKIYVKTTKGDISVTTLINVNKMFTIDELTQEEYRPQYHFSPETNFMNDPNGLVYDPSNQTWHMFFQKQPGVGWVNGQMWGHAQSKDLVNWQEMPIAMHVDELGLIFSGSAVVDEDNTSGFFTDNKPGESKLVAMFTHHGHGTQVQSIAYSKDHGITWTKYSGNPVVENPNGSLYSTEFRDPKVFRYDNTWYMVAAGGRGRLFASDDLKSWNHVEDFFFANGDELHSECPDFFPIQVDNTKETKWVYSGGGEFYVIGDFVKKSDGYYHFVAETNRIDAPNGKTYMYATQSYYNDPTGKNRRMMVSWLQDYSAPDAIPEKLWNGIQSLPLEIGLKTINGKLVVTHTPVEEVNTLHDSILFETKDKVINETSKNLLAGVTGRIYDLEAEFILGSAKEFGFNLRTGDSEKTVFKYNTETKKMILDKTDSGKAYNNVIDWELLPSKDNKVKLRILVDEGVMESFGNDGEANISDLCFPSDDSVGMEVFAKEGDVTINSLKIYDMKSMYSGKSLSQSGIDKVLSLATSSQVKTNETFQVVANVYPSDKEIVQWIYDEGLTKISEDGNTITLKATKPGNYKVKASLKDGSLSKESTIRVFTPKFDTNLSSWKKSNGKWVIGENGLRGDNAGEGDSFNIADTYVKKDTAFTYEGDISFTSGTATGLVFGVQDRNNPGKSWMCINIEKGNKNVAKLFKNTGYEDWSVEHALSEDEKNAKEYHFKVVYDGKGTLQYYLNDTMIASKTDADFNGGYVGMNTFHSDATFNNVTLTTDSPITSIVTNVDDFEFIVGTNENDLIKQLPTTVNVEKEDKLQLEKAVSWDITNVDFQQAETYTITGVVADTSLELSVTVTIKDITLLSLNPSSLSVQVVEGIKAEDVYKQLKKDINATFSDGSNKILSVTSWDATNVDFNTAGTYQAIAYIDNSSTITMPVYITILKKDVVLIDQTILSGDESVSVEGRLPEGITLQTTTISNKDADAMIKDKAYLKTHTFEHVLDLSLWLHGEQYIPDTTLTIRMKIRPEWANLKLDVVYMDADGNLISMNAQVINNELVFKTDHLSIFAITSQKDEPKEDVHTGDTRNIASYTLMLGASALGLVFLRKRHAKHER